MLAGAWIGAPEYDLTSLSNGGSWVSTGPAFNDGGQSGDVQFFYVAGAGTSTSLTVNVHTNYSSQSAAYQSNVVFYDVAGANPTSPYCGSRSTASGDQISGTYTNGTTVTPCSAGGLVFLQLARASNTTIEISPGNLDSATVTPMHQDSSVDQNNGWAHDQPQDTSPRQYTWIGDDVPGGWAATAVCFQ